MTEEQATKLLIENEWCTFSDARELLLEAAAIGAKETMESIDPELRRLHAENEALKLQITSLRTPLTTDQKLRIALDCNMRVRTGSGAVKYATAIEAAHGIKP